jgi:glyoxylase I family protein
VAENRPPVGRSDRGNGSIDGMAIPTTAYAHVRLTVTDIARSRSFYDDVFGLPVAVELPPDADEATKEQLSFLFGGVIYQLGDSLLGLRPVADDSFNENRVGLDHVSFAVGGRADLDAAATTLDGLGVAHEGVKDIGSGWILEFRDPDDIALELFAPKPS